MSTKEGSIHENACCSVTQPVTSISSSDSKSKKSPSTVQRSRSIQSSISQVSVQSQVLHPSNTSVTLPQGGTQNILYNVASSESEVPPHDHGRSLIGGHYLPLQVGIGNLSSRNQQTFYEHGSTSFLASPCTKLHQHPNLISMTQSTLPTKFQLSNSVISALLPTEPIPPSNFGTNFLAISPSKIDQVILNGDGGNLQEFVLTPGTGLLADNDNGMSSQQPSNMPNVEKGKGECSAEIVTTSVRELREKGSSFLRSHASKHSITNASRKKTSVVVEEIVAHYVTAHNIAMILEEGMDTSSSQNVVSSISKQTVYGGNNINDLPPTLCLPRHPVSLTDIEEKIIKTNKPVPLTLLDSNSPVPSSRYTFASSISPNLSPCGQNVHVVSVKPVIGNVINVQNNVKTHPVNFKKTVKLPLLPQQPLPLSALQQSATNIKLASPQPVTSIAFPTMPLPIHAVGTSTPTIVNTGSVVKTTEVTSCSKPLLSQKQSSKIRNNNITLTVVTLPTVPLKPEQAGIIMEERMKNKDKSNVTVVGGPCKVPIIANSYLGLSSCGTSALRPEAAAHKVHNASRKSKDKVIEELWLHYQLSHENEINSPIKPKARAFGENNRTGVSVQFQEKLETGNCKINFKQTYSSKKRPENNSTLVVSVPATEMVNNVSFSGPSLTQRPTMSGVTESKSSSNRGTSRLKKKAVNSGPSRQAPKRGRPS